MSAERVPQRPAGLRLAGSQGEDAIGVCLAGLMRALRMPADECEAIREELESHLRERVRDLEIGGMTEDDAVRCAAAELGDVSHLAARYREARAFPRRRLMMNLSMLAVAGAAVVVGVVTLAQPSERPRASVFSPPAPTPQEQTALARPVQAEFQDVTAGEVFAFVSQTIGMPISVVWASLPNVGPDSRVSFAAKNADLATILTEVGDDLGAGAEWTLACRVQDGVVRVATDEYFDRREIVLASYDLSGLAGQVSDQQFSDLIREFVHPSGWKDNGGDMARFLFAGSRMFVEAPKRYHVQIQWFLDELTKTPGRAAGVGGTPTDMNPQSPFNRGIAKDVSAGAGSVR